MAVSSAKEARELALAEPEEPRVESGDSSLDAATGGSSPPESASATCTVTGIHSGTPEACVYEVTDLTSFAADIAASRFYDPDYEPTLKGLIGHIVENEGPILDSLLVNRIARAHGLQRSGRVINERVSEITKRHFHIKTDPIGGSFVWLDKDMPDTWAKYRTPASEENARKIEEIAFEELRSAVLTKPAGDVPVEVARMFGIRRLASAGRERIEAVIKNCEITHENGDDLVNFLNIKITSNNNDSATLPH